MGKGNFFILLAFNLLISTEVLFSAELTGLELAEKVFHRERGISYVSRAQMVLVDSRGKKRSRIFNVKRKVKNRLERQIFRFKSPADIDGTGVLTVENRGYDTEQFLFLPALRRSRRVVTSQKSQRLVNSDFTYEDMERHPVKNYRYRIKGFAKLNDFDCYILETIPLETTSSQYGRTVNFIQKETFIPVFVKFYNDRDDHIKTFKVLSLKQVEGVWTEMVVSMEDLRKNHKTFIKTLEVTYSKDIPDDDISRKSLEIY